MQKRHNHILKEKRVLITYRLKKQRDNFTDKIEVLGKRIRENQKDCEALLSTGRRQFERPLNKIEELWEPGQIVPSSDEEIPV